MFRLLRKQQQILRLRLRMTFPELDGRSQTQSTNSFASNAIVVAIEVRTISGIATPYRRSTRSTRFGTIPECVIAAEISRRREIGRWRFSLQWLFGRRGRLRAMTMVFAGLAVGMAAVRIQSATMRIGRFRASARDQEKRYARQPRPMRDDVRVHAANAPGSPPPPYRRRCRSTRGSGRRRVASVPSPRWRRCARRWRQTDGRWRARNR